MRFDTFWSQILSSHCDFYTGVNPDLRSVPFYSLPDSLLIEVIELPTDGKSSGSVVNVLRFGLGLAPCPLPTE